MLLNFETEANSLRPKPKGPESKAETEADAEAKILASRPVWSRVFNISGFSLWSFRPLNPNSASANYHENDIIIVLVAGTIFTSSRGSVTVQKTF